MVENHNRCLDANSPVSKADLENTMLQIRAKEKELQRLSDLSIALGFLCEHFITSISIFLERTSQVLRSCLQEEAPLAKAYVDVRRSLITSRPNGKSDREAFAQAVVNICKIRGGTLDAIIEQIERLIINAHRQNLFLESSAALNVTPEQTAACASDTCNAQGRAVKLLTRKVEKAELGYSLVKDIEALLQETRIIVG